MKSRMSVAACLSLLLFPISTSSVQASPEALIHAEAFAPRPLWHFQGRWPFRSRIDTIQSLEQSPAPENASETPNENPNEFLRNVRHHAETAASYLDVPSETLDTLLKPQRVIRVQIQWMGDDGQMKTAPGWRIIHFKPEDFAGKGGLRMVATLVEEEVQALAAEMDVKLTGSPLGGAKGGVAIDPRSFSRNEYARLMRAYTHAILNKAFEEDGQIAFGVDFDVPAPDINTSPAAINLMNIAVDSYIEWLVKTQDHPTLKLVERADDTSTPYLDAVMGSGDLRLAASFTGKSLDKGGSHVRTEATGLGLAYATVEAIKADGRLGAGDPLRFHGQTVAIQGFGNVGQGAVKSFTELGANVQAIAEFDGHPYVLYVENQGFSDAVQSEMKKVLTERRTLRHFPETPTGRALGMKLISIDEFWALPVDILAPCAKENSLTVDIAPTVRASYVAEGANGPTTYAADDILKDRGITVIPDVLANSGGVIVSSFEMDQNVEGRAWSPEKVREKLHNKIHVNFEALSDIQGQMGVTLRTAAYIRWIQLRLGDAYKPSLKNRLKLLQWQLKKRLRNGSNGFAPTRLQRESFLSA